MRTIACKTASLLILAASAIISSAVLADDDVPTTTELTYTLFTPNDIKWIDAPKVMPQGTKMAILKGDPNKKGPYIVRCKLPANFQFPAHSHSTTEYITIISGTVHLGQGNKLDTKIGRTLPAGSFLVMPKHMNFYSWTTDEAIVQIHGNGPWGTKYVNKADDPRNKKK